MKKNANPVNSGAIDGRTKYQQTQNLITLQPSDVKRAANCQWVDKAAILLEFGISERTLYTLRKANKIPHGYIGGIVFYNRTAIEEMLLKGWRMRAA